MGPTRLPAELRLACSKFDNHIRILIQPGGNQIQIFRPVRNMQSDKGSPGMFLKNMVPLCNQDLFCGKLDEETPCRILVQFLVALIVTIDGSEKRDRIGRMDGHGNSQSAAFLPDGSSRGSSTAISLPDLSRTPKPKSFRTFNPRAPRRTESSSWATISWLKFGIVDLAPVNLRKNDEAIGVRLDHLVIDTLEFFAPHPRQNDDLLHIGGIHPPDDFRGGYFVSMDASRIVHVIVHVDDRKFRARYLVRRNMKHGDRIKVFEQKRHMLCGVRILAVLNVLARRKTWQSQQKKYR